MGKTIRYVRLSPSYNWSSDSVAYKGAYAQVTIFVDDNDPLHYVTISLYCRVTANNNSSSSKSIAAGLLSASIYDSNLVSNTSISTTAGSLSAGATKLVGASEDVATIARTESSQTLTFGLSLTENSRTYNGSYTLTIPPYKQNATNSNRRITYTVDGTKYDLLNYL